MHLGHDLFGCEFCGREFERRSRRGRHPHYCSRTCRQRAYESRRRGAYVLGMPRAPLPRPNRTRTYRPAYETGVKYPMRHALRPDGVPDRFNNRPTLCGTRAHTSPVRFEPWLREIPGQRTCRTCRMIAERFPAIAPPDAPNDLARARHLFGRLRAAVAQPTSHTELRTAVASVLAQLEPAVPPPTLGDLPDPPAG